MLKTYQPGQLTVDMHKCLVNICFTIITTSGAFNQVTMNQCQVLKKKPLCTSSKLSQTGCLFSKQTTSIEPSVNILTHTYITSPLLNTCNRSCCCPGKLQSSILPRGQILIYM